MYMTLISRWLRLTVITLITSLLGGLVPMGAAQAAQTMTAVKFVWAYGALGTTPQEDEKTVPIMDVSGVKTVSDTLNVDSDPAADLSVRISATFDASRLQVGASLTIEMIDAVDRATRNMPVRVEAVAVVTDEGKSENLTVGYDARGYFRTLANGTIEPRPSAAPDRFQLDLSSCTTPYCLNPAPDPACVDPCEGTRTTLKMNVITPGPSIKILGERSKFDKEGRTDPTRGELNLDPVPGSSAPLALELWQAKFKRSSPQPGEQDPTLTRVSLSKNNAATNADVHVCRLKGSYTPRGVTATEPAHPTDDACDALHFANPSEAREINASIYPLPRDVGVTDSRANVAVTLEEDPGFWIDRKKITYQTSQRIDKIDVTDTSFRLVGADRYDSSKKFQVTGLPTYAQAELISERPFRPQPVTQSRIESQEGGSLRPAEGFVRRLIYNADNRLDHVDVDIEDRFNGSISKSQSILLEGVPTHVDAFLSDEHNSAAGDLQISTLVAGLRRACSWTASTPGREPCIPDGVDLIDYAVTDGDAQVPLPSDLPANYVFSGIDSQGTDSEIDDARYTRVALHNVLSGGLRLGHWKSRSTGEEGLEELDVRANMAPVKFRAVAGDLRRSYDVQVESLPEKASLTFFPRKGTISYLGAASMPAVPGDGVSVRVLGNAKTLPSDSQTQYLFGRATSLDVQLDGIPTRVEVQYPVGASKNVKLQAVNGQIDFVKIVALGPDDVVPSFVGPDDHGVIFHDIDNVKNATNPSAIDEFIIYAQVFALETVELQAFDKDDTGDKITETRILTIRAAGGKSFILDIARTGEHLEYRWTKGTGGYSRPWEDPSAECTTRVVEKYVDYLGATLESLPASRPTQPGVHLVYENRDVYGMRECYEHANGIDSSHETKLLEYRAPASAGTLNFERVDEKDDAVFDLSPMPKTLDLCIAESKQCLPDLVRTGESSLGTLVLDSSEYVTITKAIICEGFVYGGRIYQARVENGQCKVGFEKMTMSDLELKHIDFWGDTDGDYSGDIYVNTTNWDSNDPDYGNNQRILGGQVHLKTWRYSPPAPRTCYFCLIASLDSTADFVFGSGFYARGAVIRVDKGVWDEVEDWSPDRKSGAVIYCPAGTSLNHDGNSVTADWCTHGAKADDSPADPYPGT